MVQILIKTSWLSGLAGWLLLSTAAVAQPTASVEIAQIPTLSEPNVNTTTTEPVEPMGVVTPIENQSNDGTIVKGSVIEESAYTLGPGDRLQVNVFQVPDYSGEYTVLVDGKISLPLVGNIQVQGLTLDELAAILKEEYSTYLKRPLITVSLLAPRPIKIAIAGEVNSPGSYAIDMDSQQAFPTLTDIITQAGGITTTADVGDIQITRTIDGQQRILVVDLWELYRRGDLAQDIRVRDGDRIVIPTVSEIDPQLTRDLSEASFGIQASKPIDVAVVGQVNRPGSYVIEPFQKAGENVNRTNKAQPPRLTQALEAAGGIKPLVADVRNIEIRRNTRNGQTQVIEVNLWELLESGDTNNDIILQAGDTVFVPTAETVDASEVESLASASFSPETIKVNVVGEVENPGAMQLEPNTPLNQAILAAGGFDQNRAKKGSVELIRLNPNGTVSKREIDVDFSEGINEESNPTLRDNDVIVIERSGTASVGDAIGTILQPLGGVFTIFRLFDLF